LFAAGERQHREGYQTQGADRNPEQFFPDIHRLNPTRADEILAKTKAR
jgi:hypothetical protein